MAGVTILAHKAGRQHQHGAALLTVLLMLLGVSGICTSLIWMMNQQQSYAGLRARRARATAVAEAGVYRALAILENAGQEESPPAGVGPGRRWRPVDYTEDLQSGSLPGKFSLTIVDNPDGALMITSTADVAGATRALRARTYLASPALLAALYGAGTVRFSRPPTVTYIGSYARVPGDRPWVHVAAAREVWFAQADVILNEQRGPVEVGPGPADPVGSVGRSLQPTGGEPLRILLGENAEFVVGRRRQRVGTQGLRAMGLNTRGQAFRTKSLSPMPEVHAAYFQRLAAANTSNSALNRSAGSYVGSADLKRKRDSFYSPEEFDQLQTYVGRLSPAPPLKGVIYVRGAILIPEGQQLRISDGGIIVEGAVYISSDGVLEVTHSPASRALPGLVTLDSGTIFIAGRARVRIHGLVYASRSVAVDDGAFVDIVGAILAGDPELSFRNTGGTVVIRYDPAVLGTPGLRVQAGAPVIGWVAAWEELP